MIKKILICILAVTTSHFLLPASGLFANSGASFLNIGTSARAISMGGAYVGVCSDASAINYNPAGLSQLNKKEIIGQHTEWISDVRHDFMGFAQPLSIGNRPSAIGISVIYLSMGEIEGRDENRQKTDSFKASDVCTTLSYSAEVQRTKKSTLYCGSNIKVIQQKIEDESATGIAMDFGTKLKLTDSRMQFGYIRVITISLLNTKEENLLGFTKRKNPRHKDYIKISYRSGRNIKHTI